MKQLAERPRLKNLEELFASFDGTAADSELAMIPFKNMFDFPNHPFRLYTEERRADMVESIRKNGILQPLILCTLGDGNYRLLAGHNRKYCGIAAGLLSAPAVIKHELTEEEAWMYVVETNLIQRSFADMLPSEKAAVLHTQHAKLFSQGKRNEILNELEKLEKMCVSSDNAASVGIPQRFNSREELAKQYSLAPHQIAQYLRIHKLYEPLKWRLDYGEFAYDPAVTLSFLREWEQKSVDKCLGLDKFKVDIRKADALRAYSERDGLDDQTIYLILSGELGGAPKKKRLPTFKVSKSVYVKYFKPNQSAKEVQAIVEKALELYFEPKG
jgi:ParB family chromosome partitioning protein